MKKKTTSSAEAPFDLYAYYTDDVLTGKQVVGEYVFKAVESFVADLENEDPEFRWVFDAEQAERYIRFIQKYTVHTRGSWAGKPFILSPWQQFFIANIFGWKHKEEGYRRYRTAYLFVARKSGKTQLAAAIAAAMMVLDKEPQGEYVFAATTRDQAKIAFDELQRITRKAPEKVREMFKNSRFACEEMNHGGVAKALSSDAHTLDGLSLQLGVMDEFHAQKTSDLLNVLKSSMGSRTNPLMLSITTAGFIPEGPCAQAMRTAKEILDGAKEDERTLTLLYELDKGDDWQDEDCWIKANPGLGTSITYDYLRSQMVQARNIGGAAMAEWLTKHGNLFQNGIQDWIDMKHWDAAGTNRLINLDWEVYMGLDLASVNDITSLALVFKTEDGVHTEAYHWLPQAAVDRRLAMDENSLYGMLDTLPNVTITPGNATDYASIRRKVTGVYYMDGKEQYDEDNLMAKYNIKAMSYDRHNSSQIIIDLQADGLTCEPMGQQFGAFSQPSKEFERMILDSELTHESCPLMRWMLGNVVLDVSSEGMVRPNKRKSGEKIDGIVATIMAVSEYLHSFIEEEDDTLLPEHWKPRF